MSGARVTLRAYAVGFGDAVLLTVERGGRTWRMLVDCGVHSGGPNQRHPMERIVEDLLATATPETGGRPRFDVVAATHRHRDHVSGFADPRWADVDVGEVWLPWTEDPDDDEAIAVRDGIDTVARTLTLGFAAGGPGHHLAFNSLTNGDAMEGLRRLGGAGRTRYLSADGVPRRESLGFPGASVWHLGPTRRPEDLRAKLPPVDERWFADPEVTAAPGPSPFDQRWHVDVGTYRLAYDHLAVGPDQLQWVKAPEADPLAAAGWLDRALNNTSLFFVVEIEGVAILFPGDAQWGAWRHATHHPGARRLLRQVAVYKVSHHASHNGTPRSFVDDLLAPEAVSVVCVQEMSQWNDLPKGDLVDALGAGSRRVVRTDRPDDAVRRGPDDLWIELDLSAPGAG